MPEKDINKFKFFFQKENRIKKSDTPYDILEACKTSLADLYENFKSKIFLNFANVESHPFLKEIERQQNDEEAKELKTCDQIFARYIKEFHIQTQREYFEFVTKFVTLFRECINNYRKSEDNLEEFTTRDGADTVPDLCNEFITEFMDANDNFNLDSNEIIELIQHFCYWLYENKYTTSRLTLLS